MVIHYIVWVFFLPLQHCAGSEHRISPETEGSLIYILVRILSLLFPSSSVGMYRMFRPAFVSLRFPVSDRIFSLISGIWFDMSDIQYMAVVGQISDNRPDIQPNICRIFGHISDIRPDI